MHFWNTKAKCISFFWRRISFFSSRSIALFRWRYSVCVHVCFCAHFLLTCFRAYKRLYAKKNTLPSSRHLSMLSAAATAAAAIAVIVSIPILMCILYLLHLRFIIKICKLSVRVWSVCIWLSFLVVLTFSLRLPSASPVVCMFLLLFR